MSVYSIERAKQLLDTHFYQKSSYWLENVDRVEQVIDWLCDTESKKQYKKEISRFILHGIIGAVAAANICGNRTYTEWHKLVAEFDISKYPPISFSDESYYPIILIPGYHYEEYKYKDIFIPNENDVIIDAGAYCGETAIWFSQYGVKKIYCFEPSVVQYPYLVKNIEKFNYQNKIIPINLGLSNIKGSFSFEEGDAGARIADNGKSIIATTTLDIYCAENNIIPTLLKFDIEGAELSALEGGSNVIQKYKPKIAICLYHKREDRIEIPYCLKNLVPEYRFYCKANHPYSDFILYAVV